MAADTQGFFGGREREREKERRETTNKQLILSRIVESILCFIYLVGKSHGLGSRLQSLDSQPTIS